MFRVLLILVAMGVASCEENMPKVDLKDDVQRYYCGRYLANARFVYCYAFAEESARMKRSAEEATTASTTTTTRGSPIEIWSKQYTGVARVISDESKEHMGIVDQCCLNPCYISDILNYC